MSAIRDLNTLKGTKYSKFNPNSYLKQNPETPIMLYQPDRQYKFLNKNHNINLNSKNKDQLRLTPNKMVHKRGGSFGTPEIIQKRNSNMIMNPRLSIYNFTMKLDMNSQYKESIKDDYVQFPSTERKIKNNYVNVKQFGNSKRQSNFIHPFILKQAESAKINKNSFQVIMPIGKGGFGKVWKVQQKRTKRIYAMKQMSKIKVINKKSVTSVINERNYLSQLNHSFLVNMVYAFEDRQNLYLIMDYLDGGDLRYHIGNRQFFNQRQTKFFIANIILSLEYLHRNKIIHRDLKPQNLVFDSYGYLRITDLGVSRLIRQDNHQDTSGTPGYMSPQVMMRRSHSYAVDYFALGVIAYELMLGKRPYVGANRKEIKEQMMARQAAIRVDQIPFKWSPHSIDFINRLLLRTPDHRLGSNGVQQIKDHPWLADIEWQKLLNHKVKSPFKPLSIEQDYQNYKQQISQDTINDNAQEINLFLRKAETQELFSGYYFERKSNDISIKKLTSFTTNHTEEGFSKR